MVRHLVELIGNVKLAELKVRDVDCALGKLAKRLSTRSVRLARMILIQAIRNAMVNDLVARNVADLAAVPTGKPGRPWGRILRAPFFPGRLDVVRVRGLAYGAGPDRTLDVYHRRDLPAGAPVLLHFHGGGFYSGSKAREARPLIRHLTSRRGFVCVSANYRLQPHVTLADQVADVRSAIAWVRAHAAEYGAEPGRLFVAGSSAGANLAIRAVCEGETGIAGLICRYGYYGSLAPGGDMPPMLVVHGEKDLIHPSAVRAFAERVRAVSSHPVFYAELPGAHHDFDMFESIRSAAVSQAVEQFTARISASPDLNLQDWQPAPES